MMENVLRAEFTADERRRGVEAFSIRGDAGENLCIYGTPRQCALYFEILCGLKKPDAGYVTICEKDLYAMSPGEAAAFRSRQIGAIPQNLGWIPELSMLEQIVLPLRLAGMEEERMQNRIRNLTTNLLPMHDLYNLPEKCSLRKQVQAAMIRALVWDSGVIVLNGCFDDFPEQEKEVFWQGFQTIRSQNALLIYFTGGSPPKQVPWTREYRI